MGRKGVSKRKKAQDKTAPGAGNNSGSNERKVAAQPEQVTEKAKTWPKGNKKG
jgi:hypothetical protein